MGMYRQHDSKQNLQFMLLQEYEDSCGPTSAAMCELFYKRGWLYDPIGRAQYLSSRMPDGWHNDGHGSRITSLARVLHQEGVRVHHKLHFHPGQVGPAILHHARERSPIILHVKWKNGGHFVVCKQMYPDGTVIILDPIYHLVEMHYSKLPHYTPPGGHGNFSGHMVLTHF